jgi:hypothetical protein
MNEQALFDKCWQALKGGESLDAILERYPDQRQELEPILVAAGQLQAVSTVAAPPAFRQQARARLLEQISVAPETPTMPYAQRLALWWRDFLGSAARPFAKPVWAGAAMSLLLAVFLLTSTTYAAQGTIPGDSLYPFKLFSEQVWLQLVAGSPDIDLTLAERRLAEARALQTRNRHDAVPETLARYQQALENWSEQGTMTGSQEQVQKRLQMQLQTLQQMEEDASIQQQVMLQEQHRTLEQLMLRFGSVVVPTPQRQPDRTPDPMRMQQTPSGDGDNPAGPGSGAATPNRQQGTPTPKTTPVTVTRTPRNTHTSQPTAQPQRTPQQPTATPQHGGNSPTRTPQKTRTPVPTAQPQQTPQQPTATPQHGENSPANTPAPSVGGTPTSEFTPTPDPGPTAEPNETSTPGPGGSGGGSQSTATPGSGGSGGTPKATKTPDQGG